MKAFNFNSPHRPVPLEPVTESIQIDGRAVAVLFQHSDRAKGLRLSIDRDGQPRVTIPRRVTVGEARQFLARHTAWLAKHLRRASALPKRNAPWHAGTEIYLHGQLARLEVAGEAGQRTLRVGSTVALPFPPEFDPPGDLRPLVENHLRGLAEPELDGRTRELATFHGVVVERVEVRAQVSRWGSCSRNGNVSLNWRLIQTPDEVRDYVILHELMHLLEMNHSGRFWTLVANACPDYRAYARWLKEHGPSIL